MARVVLIISLRYCLVKSDRLLGEKLIAFLSQLENFQKKLWLKKKFVTQTDYCLTLDYFQGRTELLDKVLTNDRQLQEWEWLYKVVDPAKVKT